RRWRRGSTGEEILSAAVHASRQQQAPIAADESRSRGEPESGLGPWLRAGSVVAHRNRDRGDSADAGGTRRAGQSHLGGRRKGNRNSARDTAGQIGRR